MSFFDSVISGFLRTFDFKGRSSRSEFWWFFLFSLMLMLIVLNFTIVGLEQQLGEIQSGDISDLLRVFIGSPLGLAMLIGYLPQIALSVRRFHDVGKSGWWFLYLQIVPSFLPGSLSFIGVITLFMYLYFMCEAGGDKNQYGSNPLIKDADI